MFDTTILHSPTDGIEALSDEGGVESLFGEDVRGEVTGGQQTRREVALGNRRSVSEQAD